MIRLFLSCLLLAGLTGCYAHNSAHPHSSTTVRVDGVGEVRVDESGNKGGKCPPGHHMKGWC